MAKNKNAMRKDGRIASQVYICTENGKRKYKTVYGKTQKEVDKKVLDLKLALQKGIDIASRNDTFEDWAKSWLNIKKSEHTFATMLYLSGVDIMTAKEQLGHADIQTTLNIYTHLDSEYKEKKIQKLDEFLNEEKTLVL